MINLSMIWIALGHVFYEEQCDSGKKACMWDYCGPRFTEEIFVVSSWFELQLGNHISDLTSENWIGFTFYFLKHNYESNIKT